MVSVTTSASSAGGRIIVVGDVMTDIIVQAAGGLREGTDRSASIHALPGGSGGNQAAWIAALGGEVALVARVGRDDVAAQSEALRRIGVDPVLAGDDATGTGKLVALVSPDGERSFFTDRGANRMLAAADLPLRLLEGAALVHVSGYALFEPGPRAAVLAFAAAARRRGLPVTLDPASSGFIGDVGASDFLDWSRFASICFPNGDEAAALAGSASHDEQRKRLGSVYALTVIKRGASGAEAIDANGNRWETPAPEVSVVDTSGAGDAFAAAFLLAHLDGRSVPDCLETAVAAGACATTHLGGRPVFGH